MNSDVLGIRGVLVSMRGCTGLLFDLAYPKVDAREGLIRTGCVHRRRAEIATVQNGLSFFSGAASGNTQVNPFSARNDRSRTAAFLLAAKPQYLQVRVIDAQPQRACRACAVLLHCPFFATYKELHLTRNQSFHCSEVRLVHALDYA